MLRFVEIHWLSGVWIGSNTNASGLMMKLSRALGGLATHPKEGGEVPIQ